MPSSFLTESMIAYELLVQFGRLFHERDKTFSAVCSYCRSLKSGQICEGCGARDNRAGPPVLKPRLLERFEESLATEVVQVGFSVPVDDLTMCLDEWGQRHSAPLAKALFGNVQQFIRNRTGMEIVFARVPLHPNVPRGVSADDADMGIALAIGFDWPDSVKLERECFAEVHFGLAVPRHPEYVVTRGQRGLVLA